jgi:membrane protease YdiL (CAAX protease family)
MVKPLKVISNISFLLVIVGAFIFLYAYSLQDSSIIFPQNSELYNKIYTFYGIAFSLTLIAIAAISPRTIKKLAQANYWKATLTRFIPAAIVWIVIFTLVKTIFTGLNHVDILKSIAYLPIGVLLTHLFVVDQIEELLFGGLIYTTIEEKSGRKAAGWTTVILFPLWHLVKTGGNIILMLTYIPLRLLFNYQRNFGTPGLNKLFPSLFGNSPQTQQSNAGAHFGWNYFVVTFIEPFRV